MIGMKLLWIGQCHPILIHTFIIVSQLLALSYAVAVPLNNRTLPNREDKTPMLDIAHVNATTMSIRVINSIIPLASFPFPFVLLAFPKNMVINSKLGKLLYLLLFSLF